MYIWKALDTMLLQDKAHIVIYSMIMPTTKHRLMVKNMLMNYMVIIVEHSMDINLQKKDRFVFLEDAL